MTQKAVKWTLALLLGYIAVNWVVGFLLWGTLASPADVKLANQVFRPLDSLFPEAKIYYQLGSSQWGLVVYNITDQDRQDAFLDAIKLSREKYQTNKPIKISFLDRERSNDPDSPDYRHQEKVLRVVSLAF